MDFLRNFTLSNLISGVKNGVFAKEYASTLAVNYVLKGILKTEDVQAFDSATTVIIEEVVEPNTEEIIVEETIEENATNIEETKQDVTEEIEGVIVNEENVE